MSALRGWLLTLVGKFVFFVFVRATFFLLTLWIDKRKLKRRVQSLVRAVWTAFGEYYRRAVRRIRGDASLTHPELTAEQETGATLTMKVIRGASGASTILTPKALPPGSAGAAVQAADDWSPSWDDGSEDDVAELAAAA